MLSLLLKDLLSDFYLYSLSKTSIRIVAKVIGILVSTFSAVEFGKLHYREFERANCLVLKQNKGNYEAKMVITPNIKQELKWWFTNITGKDGKISHGNP